MIVFMIIGVALISVACGKGKNTSLESGVDNLPNIDKTSQPEDKSDPDKQPESQPQPEPLHYNEYDIRMDISPETRIIKGVEKIKFPNQTGVDLDEIYLNVYLNAFSRGYEPVPYFDNYKQKIFKNGKDYGYITILNASCNNEEVKFSVEGTALGLSLDTPISADDVAELTIQFEVYIPMINHRMGANSQAIWLGNTIPTLAVYDQDGWHTDPYYPAGDPFYTEASNFTVNISTPIDYTVVGTGRETTVESENIKTTTITAKLVRDFACAVSNQFEKSTVTLPSGIEINMYHYSKLENVDQFLDIASRSVEYYSEKIESYPYTQLDIVECGLFFEGGMEYPQVIFMDSDYLKDEKSYRSLAHEIGHQWFYNVIGNNQVKEPWLDEGMTMVVQEGIFFDEEGVRNKMRTDYNSLKQKIGSIGPSGLYNELSDYDTWSDYYHIQYTRGKLMVYSLSQKMGQEKFDEFLKAYYGKFSYKIVNKEDFIGLAEEIYGGELKLFFSRWMEGKELPPLYE